MNEEQLNKIQSELMGEIDGDLRKEEVLIDMAKTIGANLALSEKITEEVEGRTLTFAFKQYTRKNGSKGIFMTVADELRFKIGQEKYKPYFVDVEVDNDFTLKENLQSTVEAFLRHILDMVQAEEL